MTLKEIRNKKNIGLTDASKKIGITKTYLYLIEEGQRNPSDKIKLKMSKAYGVSPTTIFLATQLTKS
jgi:transcriptional regulator with XRE-family HTH domain